MSPNQPSLIAVDWGTTALRAYLVAGSGAILARNESAEGILATEGRFAPVLERATASWRAGERALPIVMSGMIGARQGWREAPYVDTPADVRALAAALTTFEAPGIGPLSIVPGVAARDGATPDVMRGEEVQVFGACAALEVTHTTLVLPGTHAKWVEVAAYRIVGFQTFMTGEVFAALKDHTILGRMMVDNPPASATPSTDGFARGIAAAGAVPAGPGALLHAIFSTRTLALFDRLAPADAADYLSGLLIGAELLTAAPRDRAAIVVGGAALAVRYVEAARLLGLRLTPAPPDTAVTGLLAVACRAGLIAG